MARADKREVHQVLLLSDPRKKLRENIVRSIASLCGGGLPITSSLTEAETANGFWRIVSAILPQATRYHSQAEQLFFLADQLFRSYDEHFREEQSLRAYLASWGELLLQYQHAELVGRGEVDVVVFGFTKLLLSCVASLKSFKKPLDAVPLMHGIFRRFLFTPSITEAGDVAMQNHGLPVLESSARREIYDLVHSLAEDRNGLDALLGLTDGLIDDDISQSRLVGFDRTDFIRSPTGYVGLFNPKAICYMNSLLTQLFMNINFRKFILGLHVADPDNSQRLLFETQKLFAMMQSSYRKAADPRDFAVCIKGTDGLPLNLAIQMDADEFYNLFFDQMEGQLLRPQDKQQFRSFYGGQTINQIKSKECKHVSERVEPFFVVQCDVLGKPSLGESLRAFVEGDVMEGENKYKCESCGGKFVDAVKRYVSWTFISADAVLWD
jgi:ubiquitin carboxyl-terminal hydrolase 34